MTKTYAQLAREIAALQASAQKQLAVEAKGAIAKINDMISKYSLTAGDLKFASGPASAVPPSASKMTKAPKAKKGPAAKGARFSDGNGNQWGGRGPRPAWLRNGIAIGRTLESFAINAAPAPASAPVASIAPSPAKNVAATSIASRRVKSAASAKGQPVTASVAAKPSPGVAPLAGAATAPVKPIMKKVAAKSVKKSTGPGPQKPATSAPVLPAKKAAAKKAVPARKKAASPSASRKAAAANRPAPAALVAAAVA